MSPTPKVAIVTGAGRGIGAAVAHELHGRGYRLALMSPSDSAARLADELGAVATQGSTAEARDLAALVTRTLDAFGRIDAVVNNTGSPPKGELLEIPDEDWIFGFDLAFLNVVRLCRLVTPTMQDQGGGAIVNISTASTFEPDRRFAVSGPVRTGLAAFTKLYSDRFAAAGIRMNCVLPGPIDSAPHGPERRREVPLRRIGTTGEIAKTVAFLLSDGAGYITGQNIRVDGGWTRHV